MSLKVKCPVTLISIEQSKYDGDPSMTLIPGTGRIQGMDEITETVLKAYMSKTIC